jgi:predicted transcriptional regulator
MRQVDVVDKPADLTLMESDPEFHVPAGPRTKWNKTLSLGHAKDVMTKTMQHSPDGNSYDEVIRELAFARMVEKGLEDSRRGRTISDEEMKRRMQSWQIQDEAHGH